jgi:Amt family ammonium transporter
MNARYRLALSLGIVLALGLGMFAGIAQAQEAVGQAMGTSGPVVPAVPAPALNTGDTAWVLAATALVLLMTVPGLALFYGGLVGQRNVLSTLMHSFFLARLISVPWVLFGYSLNSPRRRPRDRRRKSQESSRSTMISST